MCMQVKSMWHSQALQWQARGLTLAFISHTPRALLHTHTMACTYIHTHTQCVCVKHMNLNFKDIANTYRYSVYLLATYDLSQSYLVFSTWGAHSVYEYGINWRSYGLHFSSRGWFNDLCMVSVCAIGRARKCVCVCVCVCVCLKEKKGVEYTYTPVNNMF